MDIEPDTKSLERTIFMHIGMHKTGTTAIQYFLKNNEAQLLRRYGLAYSDYYFGYAMRLGFLDWKTYLSRLRSIIASTKDCDIIISDEDLSVCHSHIEEILDALDGFKLKIICYVRRQDTWLQTFYSQFVAWPDNYTGTFENWLLEHGYALADYHARLKPWADAIGLENFILRVFDKQRKKTWLIDDFLGCIGVMECDALDFTPAAQGENISLNRDCLEVKRIINRPGLGIDQGKRIADLLQEITTRKALGHFGGVSFFSPKQRLEIIERYSESNQRLAREFLGKQDGELFTEPLPDAGLDFTPYSGLVPERAYEIMAELVVSLSKR